MKLFIVLLVTTLIAASALAKDVDYFACTKDHRTAVLSLNLNDAAIAADTAIASNVELAFQGAARTLDASVLITSEGYTAFIDRLSLEALVAIDAIYGPPVIGTQSCTP